MIGLYIYPHEAQFEVNCPDFNLRTQLSTLYGGISQDFKAS